jgi:hypothetical protein
VAGAAAVSALLAARIESGALDKPFGNILVAVTVLLVPFLCVSWAGGWVFLNLELWAHRHYLTYLEEEARQRRSKVSKRLYLYPDVIQKVVYEARPSHRLFVSTKWDELLTYSAQLDVLVALFPVVAGLIAMVVGAYVLWQGGSFWWRASAFVYAALILNLYTRVFIIKRKVSNQMKSELKIATRARIRNTWTRGLHEIVANQNGE